MEQNLIKSEIESRIFTIRGMQVMLDKDLAELYGVNTMRLNEQVRRNIERFPETFCFQLSKEEMAIWISQFAISKSTKRGFRKQPLVFTEYGVAMVSAVLRSPIAIETSIHIISAFIEFRKGKIQGEILTSRVSNSEQILAVHQIKIEELYKKLEGIEFPKSGVFFNDQIFDAYVFSSELISKAKKSIILIDNYIDETTLLQLSKRNKKVHCVIYTEKLTAQLKLDLEKHNAQYPPIEIRILKNTHDRFLLLDEKELYHIGASLKDMGKRWFAFSRMDGLVREILNRLS
jgi:hypothetical protein